MQGVSRPRRSWGCCCSAGPRRLEALRTWPARQGSWAVWQVYCWGYTSAGREHRGLEGCPRGPSSQIPKPQSEVLQSLPSRGAHPGLTLFYFPLFSPKEVSTAQKHPLHGATKNQKHGDGFLQFLSKPKCFFFEKIFVWLCWVLVASRWDLVP